MRMNLAFFSSVLTGMSAQKWRSSSSICTGQQPKSTNANLELPLLQQHLLMALAETE